MSLNQEALSSGRRQLIAAANKSAQIIVIVTSNVASAGWGRKSAGLGPLFSYISRYGGRSTGYFYKRTQADASGQLLIWAVPNIPDRADPFYVEMLQAGYVVPEVHHWWFNPYTRESPLSLVIGKHRDNDEQATRLVEGESKDLTKLMQDYVTRPAQPAPQPMDMRYLMFPRGGVEWRT